MANRGGFLRRVYEGFEDFMMKKEVVGVDKMGNQYVRWVETFKGQQTERREVKWAKPYMLYTPDDVPVDWRMWLRKLRDKPPTEEEVNETQAKAAALKEKVQRLDELERQRRLRQAAQGAQAQQPGNTPPDVSRLIQQMSESGNTERPSTRGSGFQPETWKPGR